MATTKCKMCGEDLNIVEDSSVFECKYSSTKQTVHKADKEKRAIQQKGCWDSSTPFWRITKGEAAIVYKKFIEIRLN